MKRPFGEDSDNDGEAEALRNRRRPGFDSTIPTNTTAAHEADDEVDPLDAFMAEMEKTSTNEASNTKKPTVRMDQMESQESDYAEFMAAKGVEVGLVNAKMLDRDAGYNSDEDVYASARAMDDNDASNNDRTITLHNGKKAVDPLPSVDHARIEYIEIEKDLLVEHSDIKALSEEQVQRIRRDLDMRVAGVNVAKPCISFAHFMFEDCLLNAISKVGFSAPTAIQQQAVPVALNGRDIIAVSKTGSGKTAAFVWPMIVHMMDQPELEHGDGPIGLILAPTRELATQIYTEAKKFGKAYDLKCSVVYGGVSKTEQFKELKARAEMLVATPGRLIDLIKMKATNLRRVSFLVLDEADRMFDLGFEPQVRSICNAIRPDRQTLLFSATFAKPVEFLAREVLTDPIRITIGNVGQSNTDITQHVVVLNDNSDKWGWLTQRLKQFTDLGTVIVFISQKAGVVELSENLNKNGFPNTSFHGDLPQHERDRIIQDLKRRPETHRLLIATDVAARGLDIKTVRTVINFDVARDMDGHVHRVGRTGRAGEKGTAYTLITKKEERFAALLVRHFLEAFLEVPEELMKLANKDPRFAREVGKGGRGGRGGRGGERGGRGRGRGGIGMTSFGGAGRGGGSNPNMVPVGGHRSSGSSSSFAFGGGGGRGRGAPPRGGGIQFQKSGSDWTSTSFK
ncbi:hypothetical protein HDU81_004547 [Chytriomyces hyalinus]|nr:hypothetical protein HDU81_004547 [Chytriomyces hyalinus]